MSKIWGVTSFHSSGKQCVFEADWHSFKACVHQVVEAGCELTTIVCVHVDEFPRGPVHPPLNGRIVYYSNNVLLNANVKCVMTGQCHGNCAQYHKFVGSF